MAQDDGGNGGMRRVRRRGLAHEAADRIRESILDGRVAPGSPLREVELAASLDVSRGSVREGLAMLEREGLVRSEWHRGARVIDLGPEDVDEVYTVRAALDRLATLTAASRMTPAHLAELESLVQAMARALEGDADGLTLIALDLAFHDRVYAIADNGRLTDAWLGVRSQVRLIQLTRIEHDQAHYRDLLVVEHHDLVRLMSRGPGEELARAAEEHVDSARRALIHLLGQAPGHR
ncbi:MAG TPA: GntR family transcriptional regulator [Nocardiopsis listeri]|uniref:GntR family transcriptional regulator n=1 Tax=Nocardiopsis listeri TaxID=53440 RepID=UPI001D556158|nr:GntR family transcriptional regulator [Nocardiopsis listeri]HJE58232.1 GntR family transcriptional regulator [Nocardiopsis listeri]